MKIFPLLLALCLWIQSSVSTQAQILIDSYRFTSSSITLLLDETGLGNAALAVSVRHLRTAYTGYFVRLRRSSDSAEADFGNDGTGWITSSSIAANGSNPLLDGQDLATFFLAADGFVVTWYDQSGNARNATQATAANQPKIVSGGAFITGGGTKPAALFDGSNDYLATSSFTQETGVFVMVVGSENWNDAAGSPNYGAFAGSALTATSGKTYLEKTGSTILDWNLHDIIMSGDGYNPGRNPRCVGRFSAVPSNGTVVLLDGVLSSSENDIFYNGASIRISGGNASMPSTTAALMVGWNNDPDDQINGKIQEQIIWLGSSLPASSARTTGRNNINAAYTLY